MKHFSFVSDSVALIQWCYPDDVPCQTKDVNVFIGCFVTAYGRLELYKQLDKLGERVLYTDTDSIIYVSKPNEWQPETGVFLGDLSDEVGPDDSICEFSASGPKTYGYRTVKGNVCLKAKGITLNAENVKQITIKNLCLVEKYTTAGEVSQLVAITNTIVRDKKKVYFAQQVIKEKIPSGLQQTCALTQLHHITIWVLMLCTMLMMMKIFLMYVWNTPFPVLFRGPVTVVKHFL